MEQSKETYSYNINKLKVYAKEYFDVDVVELVDGRAECIPQQKLISLSKGQRAELKLYSLLHEIGHLMQCIDPLYMDDYGELINQHHRAISKKTSVAKYHELKHEIVAWTNGKKLAKQLDIEINNINFEKYSAKCIMTYVYDIAGPYYLNLIKNIRSKKTREYLLKYFDP